MLKSSLKSILLILLFTTIIVLQPNHAFADEIDDLIKQLGDDKFENREKAQKDLEDKIQTAEPEKRLEIINKLLDAANKNPDPEIQERAQQILNKFVEKEGIVSFESDAKKLKGKVILRITLSKAAPDGNGKCEVMIATDNFAGDNEFPTTIKEKLEKLKEELEKTDAFTMMPVDADCDAIKAVIATDNQLSLVGKGSLEILKVELIDESAQLNNLGHVTTAGGTRIFEYELSRDEETPCTPESEVSISINGVKASAVSTPKDGKPRPIKDIINELANEIKNGEAFQSLREKGLKVTEVTDSTIKMTAPFNLVVRYDLDPCVDDRLAVEFEESIIGGELLLIDNTALFQAGISQSLMWIIPTLAGIAGAGILIRHKLHRD